MSSAAYSSKGVVRNILRKDGPLHTLAKESTSTYSGKDSGKGVCYVPWKGIWQRPLLGWVQQQGTPQHTLAMESVIYPGKGFGKIGIPHHTQARELSARYSIKVIHHILP